MTVTSPSGYLPPETVRERTRRSVIWRLASQLILQVSRVAVAIVLARLLTPSEYGIAGMVLVFSAFILPFADLGLGAGIVQRPSIHSRDLATVFWLSLGAGVLFTGIGLVLAGPIAAFYGEPQVEPLFSLLSLAFLVISFETVPRSLLMREIDFRSIEVRSLIGTAAGAVVAIFLAAKGYGPWALVAQLLVMEVVFATLLWFGASWHPRLGFSLASARDLGGFGAKTIGARILSDLRQNVDRVLVGRVLGSGALGVYGLAYNIVLTPFARVVVPVQDVLFPALSRIGGGRETTANAWVRVNRVLVAISLPALLGLIIVAPDFVSLVLGDRWSEVAPVMQALAWAGLMQALQGLNASTLTAMNRAGTVLVVTTLSVVASLAGTIVGLSWGIQGVAVAAAIVSTITFVSYTWLVARILGISLRAVASTIAGVVQATVVMVAVLLLVRRMLADADVPVGVLFVIEVTSGALVYVAMCSWRAKDVVADVRAFKRRAEPAAAAPEG